MKVRISHGICRLCFVLLTAAMLCTLCILSVSAEVQVGYCGDKNVNNGENVSWSFDTETKVLTVSGSGAMRDYSGYGNPFWDLEPKEVVIENGVTTIGKSAFQGCESITTVTVDANVESIGNNAFYECKALTEVIFPTKITAIADYTFYLCESLQSVTMYAGITTIGTKAFEGCKALTAVALPATVKTVGDNAFKGCSELGTVTFGAEPILETIGTDAFSSCSKLATIALPSTVTTVSENAFWGCQALTAVEIPAGVTVLGNQAFQSCENLNSVTFAAGSQLTTIGTKTFSGCAVLTAIEIPDTVKTIQSYAFYGCTELATLTFNKSSELKTIGENAFEYCTSLTEVTIPEGVTEIGQSAFAGGLGNTSKLAKVTFLGTAVTKWGTNIFVHCADPLTFHFPCDAPESYENELESLRQTVNTTTFVFEQPSHDEGEDGFCKNCGKAFGTCGTNLSWLYSVNTKILSIVVENDAISNYAMTDYSEGSAPWYTHKANIQADIAKIVIADKVTNIGAYAFYGCPAVTEITIPATVTAIGEGACKGCTLLASVSVPADVTAIGASAFKDCSALTEITVPEGVTAIGASTFEGCTLLASVSVPAGVNSIGNNAFAGTALTAFSVPANVTVIGEGVFAGSALTAFSVPANIVSIGDTAFAGCPALASVTFDGNSVLTSIGSEAFKGCTVLKEIKIPATVETVGSSAFADCSALADVTFNGNAVTSDITGVFSGCSVSLEIKIPCSGTLTSNTYTTVQMVAYKDILTFHHTDEDKNGLCDNCNECLFKLSATVSTKGELVLNFKINPNGAINTGNYTVYVSSDRGNEEIRTLNSLPTGTMKINGENVSCYIYPVSTPAKEMDREFTLHVLYSDEPVKDIKYSVKQYYQYVLSHPEKYSDEMQAVAYTTLNYSAAAQQLFKYHTENLVNAGISAPANYTANAPADKTELEDELGYTPARRNAGGGDDVIALTGSNLGCSLLLNETVSVRLYFAYTGENSSELEATINDIEVEIHQNAGETRYYVETAGISAKDLTNEIMFYISDGFETALVWYSPMVYLYNMYENTSYDHLADFCKAMYMYYKAAVVYASQP